MGITSEWPDRTIDWSIAMHKIARALRENPPTVGNAAYLFIIAVLVWVHDLIPDTVPDEVTTSGTVLIGVVALRAVGRLTQRFTIPTEWLDHDTSRDLMADLAPPIHDDTVAELETAEREATRSSPGIQIEVSGDPGEVAGALQRARRVDRA